jgi:hypothetical protein
MNFKEFWKNLQDNLKHDKAFVTLGQKKKFNVYFEYNKNEEWVVRVIPESGKIRGPIHYNEFEGIWNDVKKYSIETRFKNKDGRLGSFINKHQKKTTSNNLSYILKLIQYIVKDQNMK